MRVRSRDKASMGLSRAELRRDEGPGNDACHPFRSGANGTQGVHGFPCRLDCIWGQPLNGQLSRCVSSMDLRLYDTLTRGKRVFTPVNPERVTMYVCGPTVYNYA